MPAHYNHTVLPATGYKLKRVDDEVRIYAVEPVLVGSVMVLHVAGRQVYKTLDGQVFGDTKAAAAHTLKLLGRDTDGL